MRIRDLADMPLLLWDRHMAPALYDRVLDCTRGTGSRADDSDAGRGPIQSRRADDGGVGSGVYLCLGVPLTSPQPASGVAVLPVGDPGATIEVCVASRKGESSHLIGQFLDCVWETYPQPRRTCGAGRVGSEDPPLRNTFEDPPHENERPARFPERAFLLSSCLS